MAFFITLASAGDQGEKCESEKVNLERRQCKRAMVKEDAILDLMNWIILSLVNGEYKVGIKQQMC